MTKGEASTGCVSTDKAKQEEEEQKPKDTHASKKQRTDSSYNDMKTDRRPSIIHGISVKRAPRIGKEFQVNLPDCS